MNPRAAINDLLPFQGSPFSQLGYFSMCLKIIMNIKNGEGGIRTHAPFRTNGFQDRLVMTTSIPLHILAAGDRNRTGTGIATHGILSPGRLPVPPRRHAYERFMRCRI